MKGLADYLNSNKKTDRELFDFVIKAERISVPSFFRILHGKRILQTESPYQNLVNVLMDGGHISFQKLSSALSRLREEEFMLRRVKSVE